MTITISNPNVIFFYEKHSIVIFCWTTDFDPIYYIKHTESQIPSFWPLWWVDGKETTSILYIWSQKFLISCTRIECRLSVFHKKKSIAPFCTERLQDGDIVTVYKNIHSFLFTQMHSLFFYHFIENRMYIKIKWTIDNN